METQSRRERQFFWKESWRHSGFILAGHDANAVLLCAYRAINVAGIGV